MEATSMSIWHEKSLIFMLKCSFLSHFGSSLFNPHKIVQFISDLLLLRWGLLSFKISLLKVIKRTFTSKASKETFHSNFIFIWKGQMKRWWQWWWPKGKIKTSIRVWVHYSGDETNFFFRRTAGEGKFWWIPFSNCWIFIPRIH